eukprot:m.28830 g.28830  ORF g.28830 m.28830 type:complete len:731 (-) comp9512_c0_seq2:157-2349(-)
MTRQQLLKKRIAEEKECPGCGWTSEQTGFVTHDDDTKTLYVTRHRPQRPEVHQILQHSCVRALSAEVGSRGPIVFGDSTNGFAFSYSFNIHDAHARGRKRQYAFIFLMSDQVHLVSSFMFLKQHFSVIIKDLVNKASALKQTAKGNTHSVRRNLSFDRFRMRRGHDMTPLSEHLQEPTLYSQIHSYSTWLLKGVAMRLFERPMEGPSLIGVTKDAETTHPVMSLSDLYGGLGEDAFAILIQNITIGNQCVILCNNSRIGDDIASLLGMLLPKRCIQMLLSQNNYTESYACNILSLNPGSSDIPKSFGEHVVALHVDVKDVSLEDEEKRHDKCEGDLQLTLLDRIESVDAFFEREIQAAKEETRAFQFDGTDNDHVDAEDDEVLNEKSDCSHDSTGNSCTIISHSEEGGDSNGNNVDSNNVIKTSPEENDTCRSNADNQNHDGGSSNMEINSSNHRRWKSDVAAHEVPLLAEKRNSITSSNFSNGTNSTSNNIPVARRRKRAKEDEFSLDDVPEGAQKHFDVGEVSGVALHRRLKSLPEHVTSSYEENFEIKKDDMEYKGALFNDETRCHQHHHSEISSSQTDAKNASIERNETTGMWTACTSTTTGNPNNTHMSQFYSPSSCSFSLHSSSSSSSQTEWKLNSYAAEIVMLSTRQPSTEVFIQWVLTLREKYTQLSKTLFSLIRAQSIAPEKAIFMLGLPKRDLPLLMFLMSSLSRPHRVKLLQQTKQSTL